MTADRARDTICEMHLGRSFTPLVWPSQVPLNGSSTYREPVNRHGGHAEFSPGLLLLSRLFLSITETTRTFVGPDQHAMAKKCATFGPQRLPPRPPQPRPGGLPAVCHARAAHVPTGGGGGVGSARSSARPRNPESRARYCAQRGAARPEVHLPGSTLTRAKVYCATCTEIPLISQLVTTI